MAIHSNAQRKVVQVCIGEAGQPVGSLVYVRQGRREHTAFAYGAEWLASSTRFAVSADLALVGGHQTRKAVGTQDSMFHGAVADTAPDAWGRRVIARDHARRRRDDASLPALTELDYLLAVDDFSRVGALRFLGPEGAWLRTAAAGQRSTPPLLELERIYQASRAVECGQETDEDLRYLQGKGTSLGGMRPKCTLVDEDGRLAIGKFPSVEDSRSVTRGEVLVMQLASKAGIETAETRVVLLGDTPVAVIRRFDRDAAGGRIPYQSVASFLQASRGEDRNYLEMADAIRARCLDFTRDLRQLWRRLVFNLLVTNVDDHLQNHGFLHVGRGSWRLAPAFDLNPFPDKARESKTWLSERDGPITDVEMLLARAGHFALDPAQARAVLAEVRSVVSGWRSVAKSGEVGLRAAEIDQFATAFEHPQMEAAERLEKASSVVDNTAFLEGTPEN